MNTKQRKKEHKRQYYRYRLKKRLQLIGGALGIIVIVFSLVSMIHTILLSKTIPAYKTDTGVQPTSPPSSISSESEKPVEESETPQPIITPVPEETSTSETSSVLKNIPSDYDYSKPVAESSKVDLDYFDDAVFIGDSRTEGFIMNTGLSNTTSYTHKGLTVDTVFTSPVITLNGEKLSVTEALAQTGFSKVYLMFGINEAGWVYSEVFVEKYAELIDTVREINPQAQIYLQSILPVSEKTSKTHEFAKQDKLNEYNQLLRQLAEEKKVFYVNAVESMTNTKGFLPEEAASDGIHLKKEYCLKWLDYLCTHTISSNF